MPRIDLILYQEDDGTVPLLDWLDGLVTKARDECLVRLERLEKFGHELRRPEAEYLGDDIYELRVKNAGANHRMLYFFRGRKIVVGSHGISKQQAKVPTKEINLAARRMNEFRAAPRQHTFIPEIWNGNEENTIADDCSSPQAVCGIRSEAAGIA